jgi:hypothetical protein
MSSSTNPRRVLEPGETVGVGDGSKTFVHAYAGAVAPRKTQPTAIATTATPTTVTIRVR